MNDKDTLDALGKLAREQERTEREEQASLAPLSDAQIDRFTDAALRARAGKVVAFPKSKRSPMNVVVAVAAALALAAGVALYMKSESTARELPRYAMTVGGGDQPVRGDAGPSFAIGRGARVTIDLRPETATSEPITAAAFLLRGNEGRALTSPIAVAPSGAVRIEGAREQVFGDATGAWDVVVFVGARAALPGDTAAAVRARNANDPRVRVASATIALLE